MINSNRHHHHNHNHYRQSRQFKEVFRGGSPNIWLQPDSSASESRCCEAFFPFLLHSYFDQMKMMIEHIVNCDDFDDGDFDGDDDDDDDQFDDGSCCCEAFLPFLLHRYFDQKKMMIPMIMRMMW